MPTIDIPAPLIHQEPAYNHDSRFKVLQWGRRRGKSRLKFSAGWLGHGPGWEENDPTYPGVLQGWDVVWIARDMPQAKGIWQEEFVPRFEGHPLLTLNHTDHFVRVQGRGTFYIRSAENINSVRGLGKRLKGILVDEGAWFDLESAWRRVLRPMLVDNQGWAIFGSTTNAGLDGNADKRTPSFFNLLCEQIAGGARGNDWSLWTGDASDNPKISRTEFDALVGEYPPDSLELAQEVFARLVTTGGGIVFSELREDIHMVPGGGPTMPWDHYQRVVVADWGWTNPAPALWIETDQALGGPPKSRVYREWWPTETLPAEWAKQVLRMSEVEGGHEMEAVIIDAATQTTTDGGPTVYEQMAQVFRQAGVRLIPSEKGPHSIRHGTQLLHTYFWTGAGQPLLTISQDCPRLWNELLALRRGDPKQRAAENPDIPAPHQSDHGFDCLRYWAASRPKPAPVTAGQAELLDPDLVKAKGDLATQRMIWAQRAQEKRMQGKMVMAPPIKLPKQGRKPWQR